jgi:hypothetical protein
MRLKSFLFIFVAVDVFLVASFLSFSFFTQEKEAPDEVGAKREENQKEQAPAVAAAARPNIISRAGWGAKDPVKEMKEHTPHRLTIHHTASPQKKVPIEKKMQNLQHFSQNAGRLESGRDKPAWPDVPYHYFIAVDGKIAEGREIKYVGDTNTDYDPSGHVLIVLEGNFETTAPAPEQLESLYELALWLADQRQLPASEIKGHNDYASTACPGTNLKKLLPALRQRVEQSLRAIHKQ